MVVVVVAIVVAQAVVVVVVVVVAAVVVTRVTSVGLSYVEAIGAWPLGRPACHTTRRYGTRMVAPDLFKN